MSETERNLVCRNIYDYLMKTEHGRVLSYVYAFNAVFILFSNSALIIGLYRTRRGRTYTRNDKLVLMLSLSDLMIAIIQLPMQIAFVYMSSEVTCLQLSMRGFWTVFCPTLSGTLILFIAVDRLSTVKKNRIYCLRKIHLIAGVSLCMTASIAWGIAYFFIAVSRNAYMKTIFFLSSSVFEALTLMGVVFINVCLLLNARKSLKKQYSSSCVIEKRLTRTIMMISVSLVVTYTPSVIGQILYGVFLGSANPTTVKYATLVLLWSLVFMQLNSGFNALIYIIRNRHVARIYSLRRFSFRPSHAVTEGTPVD